MKVKTYLQGVDKKTLVKINLHPNYLPVYSPERRVELPEDIFKELVKAYKAGATDSRFHIVISFPWEKELKKTCVYIKRPVRHKLLENELITKELEGVFNYEHKTIANERVEVYPEFYEKVLTPEELKYAYKKTVNHDTFDKVVNWWTMWKALFSTYEVMKKYNRTVYYVQAYGTNPVAAVSEYPVYVNIDTGEKKSVTKIEVKKRIRLINLIKKTK